jgi:hypothetical protein
MRKPYTHQGVVLPNRGKGPSKLKVGRKTPTRECKDAKQKFLLECPELQPIMGFYLLRCDFLIFHFSTRSFFKACCEPFEAWVAMRRLLEKPRTM